MQKKTKKYWKKQEVEELAIDKISELGISATQARTYYKSALDSQCVEWKDWEGIRYWINHQFKPNLVYLTKQDYIEAAIESLKVQFNLSSTDFGTSRQRYLGQKWSDTIKGYLGKIALRKYLTERYKLEITVGNNKRKLDQYIDSDIYYVKTSEDEEIRQSNLKISLKTTKANGIWLDIPSQQFNHSDVFILIKLGISVDHLFSFFKEISVFKDKILKIGQDHKLINKKEAQQLYKQVADFENIIAYIPGYILAKNYQNQTAFDYDGNKGIKNYTITDYAGEYIPENIDFIKKQELVSEKSGKVKFQSIGKFTQQNRYVFGMSTLEKYNNWQKDIISHI